MTFTNVLWEDRIEKPLPTMVTESGPGNEILTIDNTTVYHKDELEIKVLASDGTDCFMLFIPFIIRNTNPTLTGYTNITLLE